MFNSMISCECQKNKYFVIRNPQSNLVLDGSENKVKIQSFTGSSPQLWRLEAAPCGRHFIVNKANGKALDIEGGSNPEANLITYQKHGRENQQWFINSDGTIVGPSGLAIDIYGGSLTPGNFLIAYPKNGESNQQFVIKYE